MKNVFTSSKHVYTTIKPCLPRLLLSPLFLLMILTLLVAQDDLSLVYTPVDFITVACGYTGPLMQDKQYWTGDMYSIYSPLEEHQAASKSIVREAPPSSTSSFIKVPYTWARLSHSEFTYRFSFKTAGQKFVRLYFRPVSYGPNFERSKALFSVKAGGFTFLHDFNASVTADAYGVDTLYREFCLNVDDTKSLNITFSPSMAASPDAYAFINGIEIVSMPSNLYYTPGPSSNRHNKKVCTEENKFRIENNTALEMLYRINIGGPQILSTQDTGMYRRWDGSEVEINYLQPLSLSVRSHLQEFGSEPDFAVIPAYAAPEQVYQTGLSIRAELEPTSRNIGYNLTWDFPVDSKFSYLIRMHFCSWHEPGEEFQIYIDKQTVEERADVFFWTCDRRGHGRGIPVYKDYVVSMVGHESMGKKTNLSIALKDKYNKGILLNGLEIFKLNDSNGNLGGPNHVPAPSKPVESQSPPNNSSKKTVFEIVAGEVSGILVLILILGFLIFRLLWKAKSSGANYTTTKSTMTCRSTLPSDLCLYVSLKEIKSATKNFNDMCIIGVGGFGNVYKGCITDGETTTVAIKRLKPESSQGAREFKTEIELLSQLRHRHLVSLIGYCADEDEMILVYDYMARGTLASHLYHANNPPLSWAQRLLICIGAARGLHYLHSGTKGTIIHRDVKSTNILLDEKWVAKISDFGLSKMGMTTTSKTHISTMVKGSFGYLDPEYFRLQQLTVKSDVYSFGVVLFEVLCGRPALMHTVETRQMSLAEWARTCHGDGTLNQIIDPNVKGEIEIKCLNVFIDIAMSCIHDKGIERPSMNDVVNALELVLQLHQSCIERNSHK